jgi:hypothetical protein
MLGLQRGWKWLTGDKKVGGPRAESRSLLRWFPLISSYTEFQQAGFHFIRPFHDVGFDPAMLTTAINIRPASRRHCDSRWLGRSNVRSIHLHSASCLTAAKLGYGHSKYKWESLPCSGQVDLGSSNESSSEVLQIFEIS